MATETTTSFTTASGSDTTTPPAKTIIFTAQEKEAIESEARTAHASRVASKMIHGR